MQTSKRITNKNTDLYYCPSEEFTVKQAALIQYTKSTYSKIFVNKHMSLCYTFHHTPRQYN